MNPYQGSGPQHWEGQPAGQQPPPQQWGAQPQYGPGQPQYGPGQPPPQQWQQQPTASGGGDLVRVLVQGNWIAAAGAAVATLISAWVLSALVVFLFDPDDLTLWEKLVCSVIGTAGSFTVDTVLEVTEDGTRLGQIEGGAVPLVIATVALALGALVFRRLTAKSGRLLDVLTDAVRAALIFGLLLLIIVAIFRISKEDGNEEWTVGASRGSAFFLGFAILLGVLMIATLARRDLLSPRFHRVHDLVAPSIYGVVTLVALLPVVGLIGFLLTYFTGDISDGVEESGDGTVNRIAAVVLASLSNQGVGYLVLGAGGRLGSDVSGSGDSVRIFGLRAREQHERLATIADESGSWGLWFSIPLMIVAFAVTAWYVVRRSDTRNRLASGFIWIGALFVVVPILTVLAGGHMTVKDYEESPRRSATADLGSPFEDSLLLALVGAVVALVVFAMTGVIDVRKIGRQMQRPDAGSQPYVQAPYGQGAPGPVQYGQPPYDVTQQGQYGQTGGYPMPGQNQPGTQQNYPPSGPAQQYPPPQ